MIMTKATYSNTPRVLPLPRDFSGFTVDSFRDEFEKLAVCDNTNIILDFSETEFIDSSGIGAMVFLYKRIEKKGQNLALLKVNGQPFKLMSLLRVDKTIPFIEQLEL